MTTEREDLAKLIFITDNSNAPDKADLEAEWAEAQAMNPTKKRHYVGYAYAIADGLITAGYRKTHTITTADELEALPDGSTVLDASGDVDQKRGDWWCSYETAPMGSSKLAKIASPFTVLHVGSEATR